MFWFIVGIIIGLAGGGVGVYFWFKTGMKGKLEELEKTIRDGIEEGKDVKLDDLDDFLKGILDRIKDIF